MSSKKSLLVTDDISNFSPEGRRRSHRLRNLAGHIAKALDLELIFLFVEERPLDLRKGRLLRPLQVRNPELYNKLEKDLKKLGVNFKIDIRAGSPLSIILEQIKTTDPMMVIIGTRGNRGIQKFFLGSVAEDVIRHCEKPVIVVGPRIKKLSFAYPNRKTSRILLATDLTPANQPATEFAIKIAKLTDSQVTVLHSVGDSIMHLKELFYSARLTLLNLEPEIKLMKYQAKAALEKIRQQFRKKDLQVHTRLALEERDASDEIKRELLDEFELLIMGQHKGSKLLHSIIGSNARKACLYSSVPVAIVRSK